MCRCGRNGASDSGSIGVCEINEDAKGDYREQNGNMRQNVIADTILRRMSTKRKHDYNTPCPAVTGKVNG